MRRSSKQEMLDLEIYSLISVTWITKDKRRIEVAHK